MGLSSSENQNGPTSREERVLWLEHIKKTPIALVGHSIRANRAANPHTRLNSITTNRVPVQKQTSFSLKGRMKSYICFVVQRQAMLCRSAIFMFKHPKIYIERMLKLYGSLIRRSCYLQLLTSSPILGVTVAVAMAKLQPNKRSTAIRTFKSDLFSFINENFYNYIWTQKWTESF